MFLDYFSLFEVTLLCFLLGGEDSDESTSVELRANKNEERLMRQEDWDSRLSKKKTWVEES